MTVYSLIGRRRHNDVIGAVPQLAEKKTRVNFSLIQILAHIKIFKVLIETNVNISNEPIFSDLFIEV